MKKSIYYGQEKGSINTTEGKQRLWDEEKIIYTNGVHAFKVIPRDDANPLVELWNEDDEQLSYNGEECFDVAWLKYLRTLIDKTLEKLETENLYKS